MEAKIKKISGLSKLLSIKTRMSDDLFHLFGKFGISHLLSSPFIIDDTMLRKSGVRKEDISRVFDNVKDRFVLATNGYFALSLTARQPYPVIFTASGKRKQGD